MATYTQFLSLYREYESLLRERGEDTKEREDSDEKGEKLKMCRVIRNYLSHSADPSFIWVSDKMQTFLQKEVNALKEEEDVVKKHLKKPDACILQEGTGCLDAALMFRKLVKEKILVQDGNSFSLLNIYDLLGQTGDIQHIKKKKVKPVYCKPLDRYANMDKNAYILCTDDGTESGKLLGQVWFD